MTERHLGVAYDDFFANEPRISIGEFSNPYELDIRVLLAAQKTRDIIAKPMYFTLLNGVPRHPSGDAVAPASGSHATFSLHQWGLDHSESKIKNAIVEEPSYKGKALDWDCNCATNDELFEVYLLLAQKTEWTGIGVYPFWINKGFHTDIRSSSHPSLNAHWFRTKDGAYHSLTWGNWKREVINA